MKKQSNILDTLKTRLDDLSGEAGLNNLSKEEYIIHNIMCVCEDILVNIENGAKIEQADFNRLGFAEMMMLHMNQRVNKQLIATKIKDD